MTRIRKITRREGLDDKQLAVYDSIVSGARGAVRGPHQVLLNVPEIAAPIEKLGAYLRYDCSIQQRQRELAILIVAAHWQADYEWFAHAPIARAQGHSKAVLAAIAQGKTPQFDDPDDALVHRYTCELLQTKRVSNSTHEAAKARFGEAGVLELAAFLGYYVLLAMTLNALDVEPPEGEPVPWRSNPLPT